jgi:hypothetical protein
MVFPGFHVCRFERARAVKRKRDFALFYAFHIDSNTFICNGSEVVVAALDNDPFKFKRVWKLEFWVNYCSFLLTYFCLLNLLNEWLNWILEPFDSSFSLQLVLNCVQL